MSSWEERMASEYRIDELAREAGTTVRNVRAYQDRGLLPPPRRSGRVGLYTDARQLARDTDRIAARFVELVAANVFEPYGDRPFPAADVPRLAELLRRLRPLAETTVDAYLFRAMERRMARELGEHYDRLMGHLGEQTEAS